MLKKINHISILFLLIFSVSVSAQLRRTTENLGLNFHYQQFDVNGDKTDYLMFSLPLQAVFSPNRYTHLSLRFDQGYQSFDENNLYGIGDLQVRLQHTLSKDLAFLRAESWTFFAEAHAPTGKKELSANELTVVSVSRIPYVASPLTYAKAGFSAKGGAVFSTQLNETANLAVGGWYFYRGEYTPLKGGNKFDPSDEIAITAGFQWGTLQSGLFTDLRYSFYNDEKVDGRKIATPGNAILASAQGFMGRSELTVLFFSRKETEFEIGSDFKSPSYLSVKLGYRTDADARWIPYVGYLHNGEGSRIDAGNLGLLGIYTRNIQVGGFPINPYLELRYGSIGDDAKSFGVQLGTQFTFQLYPGQLN
ncbi:MAG: hypothetical protein Kow0037_00030 [Calditrichia bacterium]